MTRRRRAAALLASAALCCTLAVSARAQTVEELGNLSIEELARVEVQSASKRAQPLGEAPTSIYVLTDRDIAESAATSLPEALRLAPNLTVQRVDARQYAISARGFNGYENANKLLVLIDGRSVYTPLHSGVFWELHSPLLEDLAQIEVISGPGGTLFGPNAVNGVVNITSKDSRDTIGVLARASAGANERTAALRFGTGLGSGAMRIYADGWDREGMPGGAAPDVDDRFKGFQTGFRADFGDARDAVTVQGDYFSTDTGQVPGDGDSGGNILARWTHGLGVGSSLQVQAYYDDYRRRFILTKDALQTFDLESQLNLDAGSHKIVLGAGARTTKDQFVNHLNPFVLDPERRRLWVLNAFAQDEFALTPKLSVIGGLKVEHSSFSGVELLPNLRIAWRPGDRALLWAAVSRAVRTPSRIDRQLVFPGLLDPAPDFVAEKLTAFEGGYRGRIGSRTSLSVSVFYNRYDDLRTTEFTPVTILPFKLDNGFKGRNYGIEAWLVQQLLPGWRIDLGLATLGERFRLKPGHNDIAGGVSLGANPHHQITARSDLALSDAVSVTAALRAMDELHRQHAPAYIEADARIGWKLNDAIELYAAGNNLLHKAHVETADPNRAQRIERSVYGGTRVRF